MIRSTLLLLSLAALASGCRKPMPSPDYTEASNRYTSLLALHGDDAYGKPEMDQLVAQLGRVPENSKDHGAAVTLAATIAAERARIAAFRNAVAPPPPAAPTFPEFAKPPPVVEAPVAVVDAGLVANDLVRGADFGAIQRKYVGCLNATGPIKMQGPDGGLSQGEGYEIHDSASCKSRMSAMGQNVLVVENGKVAWLMPKSSLTTVMTLEDGGKIPGQ
jgi:hypothetical protein